jgi:hypothetical protein
MSFRYDVFISYSHEDRAWAHRIRDNLDHRGLKAFVDERALRAGTAWADELRGALDDAQHLIVLSSRTGSLADAELLSDPDPRRALAGAYYRERIRSSSTFLTSRTAGGGAAPSEARLLLAAMTTSVRTSGRGRSAAYW